jgi:hypothetical protein
MQHAIYKHTALIWCPSLWAPFTCSPATPYPAFRRVCPHLCNSLIITISSSISPELEYCSLIILRELNQLRVRGDSRVKTQISVGQIIQWRWSPARAGHGHPLLGCKIAHNVCLSPPTTGNPMEPPISLPYKFEEEESPLNLCILAPSGFGDGDKHNLLYLIIE